MDEWREYQLKDVCSRLSSGKSIKSREVLDKGKYPVYGGNGLRGYSDKANFSGECAIIGRQGAYCGNVRYFSGTAYMTEHAIVTVANENNSTRFLAYLLSMMHLGRLSGQSAQPGLSVKTLGQQIVKLPSYKLQNQIASVLTILDDKIEINNQINKNLEAQARAYFIDRFIANADPTWPQGTLSDLGTVVGGGTPSKKHPEYYSEHGISWITPKDLSVDKSKFISHGENDISDIGFSNSSATKMPKGTVLFSSRAPIGYIAIALNVVTTNQGFKSVIPNTNVGTAYIYFFLKQALPIIEGIASGSTFKEISGSGMKSVPAVIPDNETLHFFSEFCKPLFEQQAMLEAESRKLSGIRNALLPKLMSGEIDVADIDI